MSDVKSTSIEVHVTNPGDLPGSAGTPATVAVASSALPTGAATSALQESSETLLSTIAGDTTSLDGKDFATQTTLSAAQTVLGATSDAPVITDTTGTISGKLRGLIALLLSFLATVGSAVLGKAIQIAGSDGVNARLLKTDSNGELQVDVLSSALPSGAATSANQATEIGHLSTIAGDTTSLDGKDFATQTTLATIDGDTSIMSGWDNAASDGASVSGDVAHDEVDAGEPVKIGGKASASKPAAVAAGDRVNAYFDQYGRMHIYDEGGGGVSGGGLSTYIFTPANSFGHGTSAYGSANTFTVSGHPFTPEAVALTKVDRFSAAGVFQETLSPSQSQITAVTVAGVTTYTVATGAFTAGDLFVVYQAGPERTIDVSTDAARSTVTNFPNYYSPLDDLADTTNVAISTVYYPSSDGLPMSGYEDFTLTGKIVTTGLTLIELTVQVTNDEDRTTGDWQTPMVYDVINDVTRNVWNCGLASTLNLIIACLKCKYDYIRIKMVVSGAATNTVALKGKRSV